MHTNWLEASLLLKKRGDAPKVFPGSPRLQGTGTAVWSEASTPQETLTGNGGKTGIGNGAFWPLLLLVAFWIVCCTLANPIGNFPLDDDWVYALGVRSLVDSGRFALPSPSSADVIAQVYWGALFCLPFGFSFTGLRISTLALGLLGVLSMFGLVREAGGDRRLALFAGASLAADPLYFGLANSFMTDVPFVALMLAAMLLFVRGMRYGRTGYLVAAFAMAEADILVRQFGLIIVAAFGIAYVFRRGISWKSVAVAVLPAVAGVLLHVIYVRWMLSTGRTPDFGAPVGEIRIGGVSLLRHCIGVGLAASLYIGFLASPFLIASLTPVCRFFLKRGPFLACGAAALAVSLAIIDYNIGSDLPHIKNILKPYGLGPLTLRDTYVLGRNLPHVPSWLSAFWVLANAVGALGGVALVFVGYYAIRNCIAGLWRQETRQNLWFVALVLALGGGYGLSLALLLSFSAIFDRYFLPLQVLGCLLVVVSLKNLKSSRAGDGLALAALAVLACLSICATHDFLAWNRARWTATATLAHQGIDATQIDGGYEFNGWFGYDPKYVETRGKSFWWVKGDEYVIASGLLPGYVELESFPFQRWLTQTNAHVIILRRTAAKGSAVPHG